ncbi:Os03g0260266 [Oryza sativa Japonica Group]|uniref:Os03g0260266 protein n=1 Tax=Oryza sativa subsp. japonica TaxID=39947 RepID=A0A0P0VVX7_ORYSJ|nr:hypothetical protein EE612_016603 [Oryza sativa]BAS83352.1 Os03g0260266 [Oryza sativa Japonica Group]
MIQHNNRSTLLVQPPQNFITIERIFLSERFAKDTEALGSRYPDSGFEFVGLTVFSVLLLCRKQATAFSANKLYITTTTGTTTRYRKGSVITSTSGLLDLFQVKSSPRDGMLHPDKYI